MVLNPYSIFQALSRYWWPKVKMNQTYRTPSILQSCFSGSKCDTTLGLIDDLEPQGPVFVKLICFQIKFLLVVTWSHPVSRSNQPSQRFYMISMSHFFSTRCCQIGFLRLSNTGWVFGELKTETYNSSGKWVWNSKTLSGPKSWWRLRLLSCVHTYLYYTRMQ